MSFSVNCFILKKYYVRIKMFLIKKLCKGSRRRKWHLNLEISKKDNETIKPINMETTTYTPMIMRKSSLYHKDCNLSNPKIVTSEICKMISEQERVSLQSKILVKSKKR